MFRLFFWPAVFSHFGPPAAGFPFSLHSSGCIYHVWPPAVLLSLASSCIFGFGLRLFFPLASGCFVVVGLHLYFWFWPRAVFCLWPPAVFLVLASGYFCSFGLQLFSGHWPSCIFVFDLILFLFLTSSCFLVIGPWLHFWFCPLVVFSSLTFGRILGGQIRRARGGCLHHR